MKQSHATYKSFALFALITILPLSISGTMHDTAVATNNVRIAPIEQHQTEEVKRIILTVAFSLWPNPNSTITFEQFVARWKAARELDDVDNFQSVYFDNNGIFLVFLDGDRVVGSGAIKRISDEMCELKRLWLLDEYRGQKLGLTMTQILLEFAAQHGYKKVCLDICYPEIQKAAVSLYKKVGFYVTAPRTEKPWLFMEKIL